MTTPDYPPPTCGATSPADPDYPCLRLPGHDHCHVDINDGAWDDE